MNPTPEEACQFFILNAIGHISVEVVDVQMHVNLPDTPHSYKKYTVTFWAENRQQQEYLFVDHVYDFWEEHHVTPHCMIGQI